MEGISVARGFASTKCACGKPGSQLQWNKADIVLLSSSIVGRNDRHVDSRQRLNLETGRTAGLSQSCGLRFDHPTVRICNGKLSEVIQVKVWPMCVKLLNH